MTPPHSIPQHVWDSLMDEARTVIGAVIDRLEKRLAEAQRQIQEFRPRLDQKSTNSSKPLRDARFSHATSNTGIGTVRARAPLGLVVGTGPPRPLRFASEWASFGDRPITMS